MCFQELLVKGAKKLGKSDIYKNHPNRPTECIGNFSQFIGNNQVFWCSDFYLCSKANSKPETELEHASLIILMAPMCVCVPAGSFILEVSTNYIFAQTPG